MNFGPVRLTLAAASNISIASYELNRNGKLNKLIDTKNILTVPNIDIDIKTSLMRVTL